MQDETQFTVTFKKEVVDTKTRYPAGTYAVQVQDIYAMVPDTVTGGTPTENERILNRLDEVFADQVEFGEWL